MTNNIRKVGRPKGSARDPIRSKVINPNGRRIDVDGVGFNKYIRQGYINDGSRLILPENVVPKVLKVGRPKGRKVENINEKVENPETKRMIRTDKATFKKLAKKYRFNTETNEFYKYVSHPKKPDTKLDVTGEEVKKYEERGYIFDREKNKIVIPGRMAESAKRNTLFDYDLHIANELDPIVQMKVLGKREEVIIGRALKKRGGVTLNVSVEIEFVKNDGEVKNVFTFTPKLMTVTSNDEISGARRAMNDHINGMIDRFTNQGSGWVINRIVRHRIHVNRYVPLADKSYIELPPIIQNKKATINIKNTDDKCFVYCLGRALDPKPETNHLERVSEHLKNVCIELGLDKLKIPVSLKDIPKIERTFNLDINVFGYRGGDIFPLSKIKESPPEENRRMVNLLFTPNEETTHYVLIKNFNKLCCKITKHEEKKHICMNCIQNFPSKERLDAHKPNCIKINRAQAVNLPKEGTYLEFKHWENVLDVPFVIYADFESILKPLEVDQGNSSLERIPCSFGKVSTVVVNTRKGGRPKGSTKDPNRSKVINPNGRKIYVDGVHYIEYIRQGYINDGSKLILPENIVPKISKIRKPKRCKVKTENIHEKVDLSQTIKTHEHIPCSYGYKVVCVLDDKLSDQYKTYRGENCIEKFFESLFEEGDRIAARFVRYRNIEDMIITKRQQKEYESEMDCYICKQSFTDDNYKVRDHCHVTGLYRGAACNKCNLKLKLRKRIPVLFHNLRGYDSHLLMQKLGRFKDKTIHIIPNNMEKYLSFSVGTLGKYYDRTAKETKTKILHELTFIDSLQFMPSSLAKLVDNLKTGGLDKFVYTGQDFKGDDTELMTRKGVYPYSFVDDWKKLDANVDTLRIQDFKNDLTGDDISVKDFEFFKSTCERFRITTLGEYHDLYLKSDVLLLADVFENFRKMCKDYYGLDCCHYLTSPGLSWDALLKMTEIRLELISDIDQHLFIEKGLRGGLSVITHRKGVANNRYLHEYDDSKESKYVSLLDANNLYGWGMIQSLPYEGFKWLEKPEEFDLSNVKT